MVLRADTDTMNGEIVHKRKQSSPMAPSFIVSAPGKVIVFGEHAVVYGQPAMAAAISLRSYLLVTALSKSKRTVTLVFPDIGLDHTWNIGELPWGAFAKENKKKKYHEMVTSLDPELVEAMQPHIALISPDFSATVRKVHQAAASSFLYLYLSLHSPVSPACIYTLRSTLPIGAGLGSSSSVNVCIAAALLKQISVLSGPHEDQPPEDVEMQIRRINRWAFVGEMCIHGNPSGVDNTVSAQGKAVFFKRIDYLKPPQVVSLKSFPELPLLLVNTRHPRSTAVELAKVATMVKKYPEVSQATLNTIGQVATSAHALIASDDFDPENEDKLENLGEMFRMNHGYLVSLGVSHPKLEHIREMVDHHDIGWTKLTGAGGGGCAITLLKQNVEPTVLRDLERKFNDAGFEQYRVTLGGDGVGLLYPAVLHNGTDEAGGEEIDQQKFLKAEGPEAIEQLVGVGVTQKREEWKFWR